MWKTGICELTHGLHTAGLLFHFTAALFLAMNEPLLTCTIVRVQHVCTLKEVIDLFYRFFCFFCLDLSGGNLDP